MFSLCQILPQKNVTLAHLFLFSPTRQVQINTTGKIESPVIWAAAQVVQRQLGAIGIFQDMSRVAETPSHFVAESQSAKVSERIKMGRNNVPFHQMHSIFLNWTAEMQAQDFFLAACQADQTFSPFFYFRLLNEWQQDTKSLIQLWAYLQTISPRKRVDPEFFANKLSSK